MVLLGVDLRSSKVRTSAVAVLDGQSQVVHIGPFETNNDLLKIVRSFRPELIAIGAALTLPAGLCCLEASCPCEPEDPQKKGRQLELELSRLGISSFFTAKRSIVRPLIYRGIKLNRKLLDWGYSVVEVYPYATKMMLFGEKMPPGNNGRAVAFMREQLPRLVQGLEPHIDSLDRNACDALVSAYTALLHCRKETDVLGDPNEGLLVLPKLLGGRLVGAAA